MHVTDNNGNGENKEMNGDNENKNGSKLLNLNTNFIITLMKDTKHITMALKVSASANKTNRNVVAYLQ